MTNRDHVRESSVVLYLLTAVLSVGAALALFLPSWEIPSTGDLKYWNGLAAFTILGIVCDLSFLRISRPGSGYVKASVAFIPLLASVLLFGHPWPMLMSGLTAFVVDTFVRRKALIRVWSLSCYSLQRSFLSIRGVWRSALPR